MPPPVAAAARRALLSEREAGDNYLAVLFTYRHLLRAIRLAFKGDVRTLFAARDLAMRNFRESKNMPIGSHQAGEALAHAQSVTKILRENVVQGKNIGGEKYKLNIHEHTEKGDNATTKKMESRVKSFKDMK